MTVCVIRSDEAYKYFFILNHLTELNACELITQPKLLIWKKEKQANGYSL